MFDILDIFCVQAPPPNYKLHPQISSSTPKFQAPSPAIQAAPPNSKLHPDLIEHVIVLVSDALIDIVLGLGVVLQDHSDVHVHNDQ